MFAELNLKNIISVLLFGRLLVVLTSNRYQIFTVREIENHKMASST